MATRRLTFGSKEEWLKHRTLIGGSDAACIVGLSPWKSNVDLWMEKTGQVQAVDISDKPAVQYGIAAEPLLRSFFALDFTQYKVEYFGDNMWLNDKFPFAAASLDGELTDQEGRKGILEIKTTTIASVQQKEKWQGRLPDNYYIQLLHYLMVTEYKFAELSAQLKWELDGEVYKQIRNYHIERDDVLEDIKFLENSERRFWEYVQAKQIPPLVLSEI